MITQAHRPDRPTDPACMSPLQEEFCDRPHRYHRRTVPDALLIHDPVPETLLRRPEPTRRWASRDDRTKTSETGIGFVRQPRLPGNSSFPKEPFRKDLRSQVAPRTRPDSAVHFAPQNEDLRGIERTRLGQATESNKTWSGFVRSHHFFLQSRVRNLFILPLLYDKLTGPATVPVSLFTLHCKTKFFGDRDAIRMGSGRDGLVDPTHGPKVIPRRPTRRGERLHRAIGRSPVRGRARRGRRPDRRPPPRPRRRTGRAEPIVASRVVLSFESVREIHCDQLGPASLW